MLLIQRFLIFISRYTSLLQEFYRCLVHTWHFKKNSKIVSFLPEFPIKNFWTTFLSSNKKLNVEDRPPTHPAFFHFAIRIFQFHFPNYSSSLILRHHSKIILVLLVYAQENIVFVNDQVSFIKISYYLGINRIRSLIFYALLIRREFFLVIAVWLLTFEYKNLWK